MEQLTKEQLKARGIHVWTFANASRIYGEHRVQKLFEREHQKGNFIKVVGMVWKKNENGEMVQMKGELYSGLPSGVVSRYVSETTQKLAKRSEVRSP